jgi:hypothetical protein
LSVHGELSDEIIYHRSQAEAGIPNIHFLSVVDLLILVLNPICR